MLPPQQLKMRTKFSITFSFSVGATDGRRSDAALPASASAAVDFLVGTATAAAPLRDARLGVRRPLAAQLGRLPFLQRVGERYIWFNWYRLIGTMSKILIWIANTSCFFPDRRRLPRHLDQRGRGDPGWRLDRCQQREADCGQHDHRHADGRDGGEFRFVPINAFVSIVDFITVIIIAGCAPPSAEAAAASDVSLFDESRLTVDRHCYECKVKYRDPTAKDLVMFLHAWTYSVSPPPISPMACLGDHP